MNMAPIDLSKAQDLLTKLIQILSPLTVKEIPASILLNKRFFIPPQESKNQTQRSVKLLSSLHAVQMAVNEWVQEEEDLAQKQAKPLGAQPSSNEKPEGKERVCNYFSLREREVTSPSIAKQAKVLINQVHKAICELSSSSHFKDPQEAPLREALKRLKPQLDRVIEAIALEEESRFEKMPHRPAAFKSEREHIFQKAEVQKTLRRSVNLAEKSQVISHVRKELASLLALSPSRRSYENSAPSIAPYLAPLPQRSLLQKKKKRKGFWFKEEEKNESDNS